MKPKKLSLKLKFRKTTVVNLNTSELNNAIGGIEDTARGTCQTGVCPGTCVTTCFVPCMYTCNNCTFP